jgi:hypothetical protein
MPVDEYDVTVHVRAQLRADSLIVHEDGSVASAVRHALMTQLGSSRYLKNGLMILVQTIEVSTIALGNSALHTEEPADG